jgi:hypothetical protein
LPAWYLVAMRYPSVYRGHVVPKGYLRGFAVDDKIAVRKGGPNAPVEVKSVEKVGWRRRPYERTRPKTGERISDVEWSLSHIEDKAPAILRRIDELWPLSPEEKSILAELVGYQLVRGPRWMEWHNRYVEKQIAEYQRLLTMPDEEVEATREHLRSDTYRLIRMLDLGMRLASIVGCMHWSLLEFGSPLLATSDHPVDVWPGHAKSRAPEASAAEGMLNALEVRFPLTPTAALLMTWVDEHDAATPRLHGSRQHAASLNAFTVANADREWFHLPGTNPPIASGGRLLPLSPELIRGYNAHHFEPSRRRAEVAKWLEATKGQTLKVRDKLVIT